MPSNPDDHDTPISRRLLIGGAAVAGVVAAGLAPRSARAQAKMSQKATNYQSTPKGKSRCDGCTQWQPPAACKLVSGVISPSGWCTLFAPKT